MIVLQLLNCSMLEVYSSQSGSCSSVHSCAQPEFNNVDLLRQLVQSFVNETIQEALIPRMDAVRMGAADESSSVGPGMTLLNSG